MKKSLIALSLVFAAALCLAPMAWAETYPAKPVEVIVPYAAGGGVDVTARILAEHCKKHLPQPLVVVNRTGGGGAVGFMAGAKAEPDGYTLIMISNSALSDKFLVKGAEYTYKSYTPIVEVAFDPAVLVVQKGGKFDLPLKDLLDYARKHPEEVRVGAGGNWSVQDTVRNLLESEAKVKFTKVPFKGGAPAVTALLGGHIDATIGYIAEFKGHYDAGKLKPIAVSGEARSPFLPDVPTFNESGISMPVGVWRAMAAPAGAPAERMKILEKAFLTGLKDPAARKAYDEAGINMEVRDAEGTARFLENQNQFYARIVKEFGLEPK